MYLKCDKCALTQKELILYILKIKMRNVKIQYLKAMADRTYLWLWFLWGCIILLIPLFCLMKNVSQLVLYRHSTAKTKLQSMFCFIFSCIIFFSPVMAAEILSCSPSLFNLLYPFVTQGVNSLLEGWLDWLAWVFVWHVLLDSWWRCVLFYGVLCRSMRGDSGRALCGWTFTWGETTLQFSSGRWKISCFTSDELKRNLKRQKNVRMHVMQSGDMNWWKMWRNIV